MCHVSTSSSFPQTCEHPFLAIFPEGIRPTFERHFQWFIDGLNVANTPSRHMEFLSGHAQFGC
ncbi:MAG: hypothetical protein Ct9H300mP27_07250 [Chloroflexota bacterium]|nr:MAG: hypothetical protein Ct9H300mP27_07250 [Chloroflexota bacterium]